MDEQTHTTQEVISNEETQQEVNTDLNAEQTSSEESRNTSGSTESREVDFAQLYNMLTERDNKIKSLTREIADLKKSNTTLLLKVNASASSDAQLKSPYQNFIDDMVKR